jgi:hypothetical protein
MTRGGGQVDEPGCTGSTALLFLAPGLFGSKSRQPFASPIPNVHHVNPLFALVADEVQVTLRFFQAECA